MVALWHKNIPGMMMKLASPAPPIRASKNKSNTLQQAVAQIQNNAPAKPPSCALRAYSHRFGCAKLHVPRAHVYLHTHDTQS